MGLTSVPGCRGRRLAGRQWRWERRRLGGGGEGAAGAGRVRIPVGGGGSRGVSAKWISVRPWRRVAAEAAREREAAAELRGRCDGVGGVRKTDAEERKK